MLLRARAVENGFYVAAPAQVGETGIGRPSYGRSLIVDPWGTVLAQAPDEETVISAELDRALARGGAAAPAVARPSGVRRRTAGPPRLLDWADLEGERLPEAGRGVSRRTGTWSLERAVRRRLRLARRPRRRRRPQDPVAASRERARGGCARALARRRNRASAGSRRRAPCAAARALPARHVPESSSRSALDVLDRAPAAVVEAGRAAVQAAGGRGRVVGRARSCREWENAGKPFEEALVDAAITLLEELAVDAG